MTDPAEAAAVQRVWSAAARNNADWCETVCRTHDGAGTFTERAWLATGRPPTYYPAAITLHPDALPEDVLPSGDVPPGYAVKDSFCAVELSTAGFTELFRAHWIHRASTPVDPPNGIRVETIATAIRLGEWQRTWSGGDDLDVFRPDLLADPAVRILALWDGEQPIGGSVLNLAAGVVGVSNVFADDNRTDQVWRAVVAAAGQNFPGVDLVGYERDDDLAPAIAAGFGLAGSLRVWLAAG